LVGWRFAVERFAGFAFFAWRRVALRVVFRLLDFAVRLRVEDFFANGLSSDPQ
jgi:hypothetical protein